MKITKNNGFDFLIVKEEEIYDYQRLAGSYAVIKCDDKYLLCYNTWRKQWELPAGQREENETSKNCAIRELYEETSQIVSDLEFKGLLKVKNLSNDEVKYNPVYFTTLEELQPFQKNNETSEIKLWNLKEQVGYIDEVDIKIFDYIK
ncbi:DNA mismatch repair protein MutT [Bacillus sp. FJAT-22090]|uniref:NUDIX domain-containing protein n=1 Tax=Bacillus sp. FJAT-22090 TaxID=1581038 RepID=UPI0006ADE89D|nr:NUDIX hydrolase [Bacillus sp. FJAT-22090]ALC85336.1 DNA mismatch repair protein MutT [Bacillus sp. FJAT-22090]